jgi:hypothetical protein
MDTEIKRKRRTYSIDPDRASDLGRSQIEISDETKRNVNRQDILDVLVELLATDKDVYKKVIKRLG